MTEQDLSRSTSFPSGTYRVHFFGDIEITVKDGNAVDRCINDEDGWRTQMFYNLDTVHKVLEHWAFNRVANGVERANRLDGWADLDDDAVTVDVAFFEAEDWESI